MKKMKKLLLGAVALLMLSVAPQCHAQAWSTILNACSDPRGLTTVQACAVDWSTAGIPGGIPTTWTQFSSIAASSGDRTAAIQTQLNSCAGKNQYVLLGTGTFNITSVSVPGGCELRGSGPKNTILNLTGTGGGGAITLGSFNLGTTSIPITGGATQGSTSITMATSPVGGYLVLTELNDPGTGTFPNEFVSATGDEGFCSFCGVYNDNPGYRTIGQVEEVQSISGPVGGQYTVTISPALYRSYNNTLPAWQANSLYVLGTFVTHGGHTYQLLGSYTSTTAYSCTSGTSAPAFSTTGGNSGTDGTCSGGGWKDIGAGTSTQPAVIAFNSTKFAGVSRLQIFANNTGAGPDVNMNECAYCWIYGIEANYVDTGGGSSYDFVDDMLGFHDSIHSNYFSNAYIHVPGTSGDAAILLEGFTTGTLIANNIIERPHVPILLKSGAAGNVMFANYAFGQFDNNPPNNSYYTLIGSSSYHGAHPQFNLWEENILPVEGGDSIWGSSSQHTAFREWLKGTSKICMPIAGGRSAITCTPLGAEGSANGWWAVQQARAFPEGVFSSGFNIVGSILGSVNQKNSTSYNLGGSPMTSVAQITWNTPISYDSSTYDLVYGYWDIGLGGYTYGSTNPLNSAFVHGTYTLANAGVIWASGVTHTLPSSLWTTKPSWWGTAPWPAIGPDTSGGLSDANGLAHAIPAELCYESNGGTDGTGSPKPFDADTCYTSSTPTAATPTFSLNAGTYATTETVTMSTTSGTIICWNMTGAPATNDAGACQVGSVLYSTPIIMVASETLYAVAGGTGFQDSGIKSSAYTINYGLSIPKTFRARTDNCATGAESGCVSGASTGQAGAPLALLQRVTDPVPFQDISTGTANMNSTSVDPDFGTTLVMATDASTGAKCLGSNGFPSWNMSSAGEWDAFSADGGMLIVHNDNGNACILYLNPTSIHNQTCSTIPCVSLTSGTVGTVPIGSTTPLNTYHLVVGGSWNFSRVPTESNILYELANPPTKVFKVAICANGTASPNCSAWVGPGPLLRTTYVDFSTETGTSALPIRYVPQGWTSTFVVGNDGSVAYGLGGGQDWLANWTPVVNETFLFPQAFAPAGSAGFEAIAVTGPTGATEPNWKTGCPKVGNTCVDGGVTWQNIDNIGGQGPGFDIVVYRPPSVGIGAGSSRINARIAKIYRGTDNVLATGVINTNDNIVCTRMANGGSITYPCLLTDEYTLHDLSQAQNGRYVIITPTGGEAANTQTNWNWGTLNGQVSNAIWSYGVGGGNGVWSSTIAYATHDVVVYGNPGFYYTAKTTIAKGGVAPISNTSWTRTEAYPLNYILDTTTNIMNVCTDYSGCGGHTAQGFTEKAFGAKFKTSLYAQPTINGNLNPGTPLILNPLPGDFHGSWRQFDVTDSSPLAIFNTDVPAYSVEYNAACYTEVCAVLADGSGTMNRIAHTLNTGSSQYFQDQNNIGVFSFLGDLLAWGTDVMNRRGDTTAGNTTCINPVRGDLSPLTNTQFADGITIYPLGNNNSNYIYQAVHYVGEPVGGGTTGAPIPNWDTVCGATFVGSNCPSLDGTVQWENIGLNSCRSDIIIGDPLSAAPSGSIPPIVTAPSFGFFGEE